MMTPLVHLSLCNRQSGGGRVSDFCVHYHHYPHMFAHVWSYNALQYIAARCVSECVMMISIYWILRTQMRENAIDADRSALARHSWYCYRTPEVYFLCSWRLLALYCGVGKLMIVCVLGLPRFISDRVDFHCCCNRLVVCKHLVGDSNCQYIYIYK